jgi:hypothetical protein
MSKACMYGRVFQKPMINVCMYGRFQKFSLMKTNQTHDHCMSVYSGVLGRAHADRYLDLKDALDHVGRDLFQVAMSSSGWIRTQLSSMIGRALSGGQSDYHDPIPPANSHFMALLEKHGARDDFHALGIDPRCASELKLIMKLVETGSIHLIEKLFIMCYHPNGDAYKENQEGIDGLSQDLWYL